MARMLRVFAFLFVYLAPCIAMAQAAIAVPDFGYKQEVRTFFYSESGSAHSSVDDRAAALVTDDGAAVAASHSAHASAHYRITTGDKVRIDYREMYGLAGTVRNMLIQHGYEIVSTSAKVAKAGQGDSFFDIRKRIGNGEFRKARYVLYGIVASVDTQNGAEPIAGTNTAMNVHQLNMAIDFNLVDIKTLQTVAAFVVQASGSDNKLGNGSVPGSDSTIFAQLGNDLATQTEQKLAEQGFLQAAPPAFSPDSPTPAAPDDAGPVTVYRHD